MGWRYCGSGKKPSMSQKSPANFSIYVPSVSLSVHDLNGLALGPDNRIWFTIGDCGYNLPSNLDFSPPRCQGELDVCAFLAVLGVLAVKPSYSEGILNDDLRVGLHRYKSSVKLLNSEHPYMLPCKAGQSYPAQPFRSLVRSIRFRSRIHLIHLHVSHRNAFLNESRS